MLKSDEINEVVGALIKAQKQFSPVQKTGRNPMFKSDYVTFDGLVEAVRDPLSANGLAFSQMLGTDGENTTLETVLFHTSGQYIGSVVTFSAIAGNRGTNEMQALGASITYMKRYALGALLGVSTDEDVDGNRPQQQRRRQPRKRNQPPPPEHKQQSGFADGVEEPFIEISAVGVHPTRKGKKRIGFLETGQKYPRVHVWSSDQLDEVLPQFAKIYGDVLKGDLPDMFSGNAKPFPFRAKVYHDGAQYPTATRAEFRAEDRSAMAGILVKLAKPLGIEGDPYNGNIPSVEWLANLTTSIREARSQEADIEF